jgi:hypothetical protein
MKLSTRLSLIADHFLSECPSLGMPGFTCFTIDTSTSIFSLPVAFSSLIFTSFNLLCYLFSFACCYLKKKEITSLTEYCLFFFPFFGLSFLFFLWFLGLQIAVSLCCPQENRTTIIDIIRFIYINKKTLVVWGSWFLANFTARLGGESYHFFPLLVL